MDKLFEKATKREVYPDRDNDQNIKSIQRFYISLNDNIEAKITLKELKDKTEHNRIYTIEAIEIEQAAGVNSDDIRGLNKQSHVAQAALNNSISSFNKNNNTTNQLQEIKSAAEDYLQMDKNIYQHINDNKISNLASSYILAFDDSANFKPKKLPSGLLNALFFYGKSYHSDALFHLVEPSKIKNASKRKIRPIY